MGEKVITVRVVDPLNLGAFGLNQLNSKEHGPFRFSPTGVGFGPADNPGFVPWVRVAEVQGWEPPTPAQDEQKAKGK